MADATTEAKRWSDVFSRSSLGRSVFYSSGWWDDVYGPPDKPFATAGIPAHCRSSLFDTTHRDAAFLDGGLIHRSPPYFYGLRGGWVIGFKSLRYLCSRMHLEPPRKLRGELTTPSATELEAELQRQLAHERAMLERRLEVFAAAEDGPDITRLAQQLATGTSIEQQEQPSVDRNKGELTDDLKLLVTRDTGKGCNILIAEADDDYVQFRWAE